MGLGSSPVAVTSKQYVYQFTSLDFHIIPSGFRCLPGVFSYLPDGKFTTRSHPEKVLKICHFPNESSSPRWGTKTECIAIDKTDYLGIIGNYRAFYRELYQEE